MNRGNAHIALRCVEVIVGRKKMFLVTNEFSLTDHQLTDLYRRRWGIEVFFRTVKQRWERSRLESWTPKHVLVEIDWSLLGIWLMTWTAYQHLRNPRQASPIQILRTLATLVNDVARSSTLRWNLSMRLKACIKADDSTRATSKASRNYPCKKKHKPAGEPAIHNASRAIAKLIRKFFAPKKSLPA